MFRLHEDGQGQAPGEGRLRRGGHRFREGCCRLRQEIVANFKDYEFFTGESMNPDGMVVLLNYREDGVTPYVTLWKHGLKSTKV